jgi:periplasmic copper chaperone A
MIKPVPLWMLLLTAAAAAPATAQVKAGALTLEEPVMRAVAGGGANTAGYLTIVNSGTAPDKLVSASCTCARSVQVHESHVMNGTAMMMAVGPLEIPAGGKVSFSPGGYHLMVMGLKAGLADGATQELTLKFQHAGEIKVPFQVRSRIGQ